MMSRGSPSRARFAVRHSSRHRVTSNITHGAPFPSNVILIGTIGSSTIIDQLIRDKKIDVGPFAASGNRTSSRWCRIHYREWRALVIAGSDKRGTIYGIYDLSEQIGVSPWYWWADVPVPHRGCALCEAGKLVEGDAVREVSRHFFQ